MEKACSPRSAQRFAALPSLCCTDGSMALQKTTHFIQDKPVSGRKAKQTTQVTLAFSYFIPRRCLVGGCRVLKNFAGQHHFLSTTHSNIWDHHRSPTDQAPNCKAQVHITFKRDCFLSSKTYLHKTNVKDQEENCRAAHLPLHRKTSRAWCPKDMASTASDHRTAAAAPCLSAGWAVRAEWSSDCLYSDIFEGRLGNPPDLSWGFCHRENPYTYEPRLLPCDVPPISESTCRGSNSSGLVWKPSKSALSKSLLSDKISGERACQLKIPSQPSLCSSISTVPVQKLATWCDISETTFKTSGHSASETLWLGAKG